VWAFALATVLNICPHGNATPQTVLCSRKRRGLQKERLHWVHVCLSFGLHAFFAV
jgi:hypothetical protein